MSLWYFYPENYLKTLFPWSFNSLRQVSQLLISVNKQSLYFAVRGGGWLALILRLILLDVRQIYCHYLSSPCALFQLSVLGPASIREKSSINVPFVYISIVILVSWRLPPDCCSLKIWWSNSGERTFCTCTCRVNYFFKSRLSACIMYYSTALR